MDDFSALYICEDHPEVVLPGHSLGTAPIDLIQIQTRLPSFMQ